MNVVNMPVTVNANAIQCSRVAEEVCKVKCPGGVMSCVCASNANVPAHTCIEDDNTARIALALGVIALVGVVALASALFLVHRTMSRKLELARAGANAPPPSASKAPQNQYDSVPPNAPYGHGQIRM
jgi:hypothetical protein